METTSSASPKKRSEGSNGLLRVYFTSLFSMLLSFMLLLGTTFAWFNNSRTASGNEINSGILEVDMFHEGVSLSQQSDHAVFPAEVWIPGQTVMQTVTVKNTGTLPLRYKLDFVPPNPTQGTPIPDEVAKCFTVLVKPGRLTAEDLQTASGPELLNLGWNLPGPQDTTLAEVMDAGNSLFLYTGDLGGKAAEDEEIIMEQDISIALYMRTPERPETVMGGEGSLYLKLEAIQLTDGQTFSSIPGTEDLTGYESEQTADVSVADTSGVETVTAETIQSVDFTRKNTTYFFQGAFDTITIPVRAGRSQVFDGSQATVTGGVTLAGGDAEGGSYTISGFTAGQVCVELENAQVLVLNNSCRFLGVTGAALELTVHGNLVGGDAVDGEQEQTGEPDGICLNVAGYDLSFTDNTVSASEGDVLTINGRQDEAEYAGGEEENNVTAFTGNKLSAGGLNTVAVRVRNDRTFAPAGVREINANAKRLISAVLDGETVNSITVSEAVGQYRFGFNDLVADDIPAETANEG